MKNIIFVYYAKHFGQAAEHFSGVAARNSADGSTHCDRSLDNLGYSGTDISQGISRLHNFRGGHLFHLQRSQGRISEKFRKSPG